MIDVRFPGIAQVISASYTLSHGIAPGVAMIDCSGQTSLPTLIGDLVMSCGSGTITVPGCKVNSVAYRLNKSGSRLSVSLLDRRWKWAWGEIDGSYNTTLPGGILRPDNERTPQQLAELCLQAMGETGYDVSGLPSEPRPDVEWSGANPAQELDALANRYGCRVVLTLDGHVRVCQLGVGNPLPDGPLTEDGPEFDLTEKPHSLLLVGGPTLIQCDLCLRAVGTDTDGVLKPVDELSYKPATGWGPEHPDDFGRVAADYRPLARACVWRQYQIWATRDAILDDEPYFKIDRLQFPLIGTVEVRHPDQIRLTDLQNDFCTDWQAEVVPNVAVQPNAAAARAQAILDAAMADHDAEPRRKPAEVRGVFFHNDSRFDNSGNGEKWGGSFSINPERGLVEFADPIYKKDATTSHNEGADIYLRAAWTLRHHETFAVVHYHEERRLGQLPTPPVVVHEEAIVHELTVTYQAQVADSSHAVVSAIDDNLRFVRDEADQSLTAASWKYQDVKPQNRSYATLLPINPDGAIQQVSWAVGKSGASTQASRNTEHNYAVPTYAERQVWQKTRTANLDTTLRRLKALEAERAKRRQPPQRGG